MSSKWGALCIALILGFAGPSVAQIRSSINEGPITPASVVFVHSGDTVTLDAEGMTHVRWWTVRPVLRVYDNTRGVPEPVEYLLGEDVAADPVFRVRMRQTGTFYFTVTGIGHFSQPFAAGKLRTIEPLQRAYSGVVVQVVCRSGNSYLDYLGELAGTPFIMGPVVTVSGFHQTDQRVGSDCAAFATYGRRRQGFRIPYGGPSGILRYLREIAPGFLLPGPDGIYRDDHGRPVKFGGDGLRPGDILHFGLQVSVFYRHTGSSPDLSLNDLVIESWDKTPHVTTIRDCGFCQYPVRAMRWR